jgi:hypothetical protein
VLDDYY